MPDPATRRRPIRSRHSTAAAVLLAGSVLLAAAGCGSALPDPTSGSGSGDAAEAAVRAGLAAGVPTLRPAVLGTLPHDPAAWTEGLEIDGDTLWESTGLPGRSRLRRLDPVTGAFRSEEPLPDGLYGEGVTRVGGRVWQLTWRDGVVLGWDADAPERGPAVRRPWDGEGWGLCHTADGRVLASDGGDTLRVLSDDLAPLGRLPVRLAGRPLPGLNELECGGDVIWADIYPTSWLARIDPHTGVVTALVDGRALLDPEQRATLGTATGDDPAGAVLNGVAAVPGTDQLLLTGKLWPVLLRVRLVPEP